MNMPVRVDDEQHRKGREAAVERRAPRESTVAEWASGSRAFFDLHQGIYKVSWPEAPVAVVLEFDYLTSSRSSGDVTAEVLIVVDDPAGQGHYQRTRLNLLADRSVLSLAKSLAERLPGLKLDWPVMLNDAVQWVLQAYRAGEPGVFLDEVPETELEVASPLPPFVAADGPTILFGDGEATKSLLALAMAASLESGVDIIPGMVPARAMHVGYCDWEWSEASHAARLRDLWAPIDGPLPHLRYIKCRLPIADERDRLRREIRDHGLELLIIDSAGYACAGAPEEAEHALALFRTLEQLGLPAIVIAHINRDDARKGNPDRPFGSTFWNNSARSTVFVKRAEQESTDGSISVGLYQKKKSSVGHKSVRGIRWIRDPDGGTSVLPMQLVEDEELASGLSMHKRMTLILHKGPLTIHEIAEALDAKIDTVRKVLRRAEGEQFTRLPGGAGTPDRWALVAQDR